MNLQSAESPGTAWECIDRLANLIQRLSIHTWRNRKIKHFAKWTL